MKDCIIKRAEMKDVLRIMEFIKKYWRADHILANSEEFFRYQHVWNDEVSFVLAEDKETGTLEGILGYIVYSEDPIRDLFGAVWKVRNNDYPMLGLKMQLYAIKNLNARLFSAVALNPTTLDMHKRWGAYLNKLNQYYILGEQSSYTIADIKKRINKEYSYLLTQMKIREIKNEEDIKVICEKEEKILQKKPIKSFAFVKHRYFNHPAYTYLKLGIYDEKNNLEGVFIAREIKCLGKRILRIVDYLGDINNIAYTGKALKRLINSQGYEYLDFYEYGIEERILDAAGFIKREENDKNIIPNYFEPFVKKNIDIDFYASNKEGDVLIYKGDGDQDRPNFI